MITFAKKEDEAKVSKKSREVITDILTSAKIASAKITSVQRTPAEQARAMYGNCLATSVQKQLDLYGPYGDAVIRVFQRLSTKPSEQVIAAMTIEIISLGPGNVSHHCADPASLNVIDISAANMSDSQQIALEIVIRNERRIIRHFSPRTVPSDPAFHIEIPQ